MKILWFDDWTKNIHYMFGFRGQNDYPCFHVRFKLLNYCETRNVKKILNHWSTIHLYFLKA